MSTKVLLLCLLLACLVFVTEGQRLKRKIKKIKNNLPSLLQEGFQMAIDELNRETEVAAMSSDPPKSDRRMSRVRKAKFAQKKASACVGSGLRETSRLIVDRYNLDKRQAKRVFKSIVIDPNDLPSMNKKPLCDSQPPPAPRVRCDPSYAYRDVNGFCNNLQTHAGVAGSRFKRFLDPDYEDEIGDISYTKVPNKQCYEVGPGDIIGRAKGTNSLRGEGRIVDQLPNPRNLSSALNALPVAKPYSKEITQLVKDFGQILDHDITFTPENSASDDNSEETRALECCHDGTIIENQIEECAPIDVSNDIFYIEHDVSCLPFTRSLPAPSLTLGPREQQNDITAFIDASNVYGSEHDVFQSLRTFSRGLLKESKSQESCDYSFRCLFFLPETSPTSEMHYFTAGDVRANEQLALTALHTIFVRYHNLIASKFYRMNCALSDEFIFQETRRIIGALMQKITYIDFLPIVLGDDIMTQYSLKPRTGRYDSSVNPSIANSFATAAFRFGHSLVTHELRGDASMHLTEAFFDSEKMKQNPFYPSKLLSGEVELASERMDWHLTDAVTNTLFASGPNFTHGLDLGALNIQRGRDHGLPPYNQWRKFCSLTTFVSFESMSGKFPQPVIDVFSQKYSNVDEIDLFPAGIAENPLPGALVGPTFACILGHQFRDLKRGDRFFYENRNQPKPFRREQMDAISATGLAEILCETTTISRIQPRPFFVKNIRGNDLISCDEIKRRGVLKKLSKYWRIEAREFPCNNRRCCPKRKG